MIKCQLSSKEIGGTSHYTLDDELAILFFILQRELIKNKKLSGYLVGTNVFELTRQTLFGTLGRMLNRADNSLTYKFEENIIEINGKKTLRGNYKYFYVLEKGYPTRKRLNVEDVLQNMYKEFNINYTGLEDAYMRIFNAVTLRVKNLQKTLIQKDEILVGRNKKKHGNYPQKFKDIIMNDKLEFNDNLKKFFNKVIDSMDEYLKRNSEEV